jgi:Flp pilus assembly protein TadD
LDLSSPALAQKALCLADTGDFKRVREVLCPLLARRPVPKAAVDLWTELSITTRSGSAEAIGMLSVLHQEGWFVHANLGRLLARTDRFAEAEASFRSAIQMAPAEAEPWFHRGVINRHRGRLGRASVCLRTCLRLNPGHAAALRL